MSVSAMKTLRILATATSTAVGISLLTVAPVTAHWAPVTSVTISSASPLIDGVYRGEGKRVIYSRSARRVWLVRADGRLSATWSVTGHPTMPANGEYTVFSRALRTKTYDGAYSFGYMVRFAHSPRGSTLGFHDLPYLTGTSTPIMPLAKIGEPGFQSGGCIRQRPEDAERMWAWTRIGTPVIVID